MLRFSLKYQLSPQENNVAVEETADLHEHEVEHIDYSVFTKSQLLEEIKKIQGRNPGEALSLAKKIKIVADELHANAESEALAKYLEDGGDKDSFEFRDGEFDTISDYFKKIRDIYVTHANEVKSQRESNYKVKETLLNSLREIVNQEETQDSHQKVKKIQEEWKATGQVPADKANELYSNFSALLNRYYDQQSIYFQFKELDRKKNLELKTKICEKAEELLNNESVVIALKELTQLHSEYKSLGPVPKEFQDELWNRLKKASDALYQKRKEYQENLDQQFTANLTLKQDVLREIDAYTSFTSNKIEQWQKKTDEITALKDKWSKIGFVSKEASKDLNKTFWAQYKKFFHNKGDFFKTLHEERQKNLNLKIQLCEEVEKILSEGVVTDARIDELKGLQRKWKDIGPTFYKKGNEIYERFKKSCDAYFDLKRGVDADKEKDFEINLVKKNDFCDQLEKETTLQNFASVLKNWESFGLVPKKDIGNAKSKLLKAWETHVDNLQKDADENTKLKLMAQVELLKDNPDGKNKLFVKEKNLKTRIQALENDISTLSNNLEFFAKSKNAEALKVDILKKIEINKQELDKLKQQYKLLRAL